MNTLPVDIKINQTKIADGSKTKPLSSNGTPASFDQILALFQAIPEGGGKDAAAILNQTGTAESNPMDAGVSADSGEIPDSPVSIEDLESILSILAGLLTEVPQIMENNKQSLHGTEESQSENQLRSSSVSGKLSQLIAEISDVIARVTEGDKMLESKDLNEMLKGASELIQQLHSDFEEKKDLLPKSLRDKAEALFNDFQNQKNGYIEEAKQRPELDKNHAAFSTVQAKVISAEGSRQFGPSEEISKKAAGPLPFTQVQAINIQGAADGNMEPSMPARMPVSDFAPEASQWIGRFIMKANGNAGSSEARFLLSPDNLGKVEIKVALRDGQLTAQIITDTTAARDALEGQIQTLKQALQQQGITLQKLDIIHQISSAGNADQASLTFSQGGFGSPQEQRAYSPPNNGSNRRFEAEHEEAEKEPPSFGYGSPSGGKVSRIDFTA